MNTNTFGLLAVAPTEAPTSHTQPVMAVGRIPAKIAAALVIENHYLHRKPPISFAFGLFRDDQIVGVVTFGVPASRHLQMSACRTDPSLVLELNRLWLADDMPRNTASWFVARAMKELPPRIIVSYADTAQGHDGTVYRAMNWRFAGWTDMDRKSPRNDYLPITGGHTRDSSRFGWYAKVPRNPKFRYWNVSGTPAERRALIAACTWPTMDWASTQGKPEANPFLKAIALGETA